MRGATHLLRRHARACRGHPRLSRGLSARKTWMAGTSPAMTRNSVEQVSIHENSLPSSPGKRRQLAGVHEGRNKMAISIAAMFRPRLLASAIIAGLGLTSPVLAQSTVYIPAILELSGAGAVSGTNFRDGMLLAIDEINAKGGILGRKINTPLLDTQSDTGISRAQIQKGLDNNPYVILGRSEEHTSELQSHLNLVCR